MPDERFRPADRIRQSREFEAIYQKGTRLHARHFMLLVLPNTLGHSRLGITLSRKVGPAVKRNLARRRLREIFRRSPAMRQAGLDLVVHGKPGLAAVNSREMEQELGRCLSRYRSR